MADTTIDSLQIEVQAPSNQAAKSIENLATTLEKLKNATKGLGLNAVVSQIDALNKSTSNMDSDTPQKISSMANALQKLSGLGSLKLSSSIANQITNIGTAVRSLGGTNYTAVTQLANGLQPLTTLGRSNLSSFITQLGRIPQVAQTLNSVNWTSFTSNIQQLSNALTPLATQLNAVSTAFSRLPTRIQQTVRATNTLSSSNNVAQKSYVNLYAAARMAVTGIRSIARVIAGWISQANQGIESANLFTVSMGRYAEEAQNYANKVSGIIGIDPAEWMRNEGTFNTIIKGFGVVEDKAYKMSQNLTQLGYDLSSFFEISVEDAMQKVSSGISGELEPLRRLGYDLSVARLQQDALNLGITKSVSKMTQAEKAQLRYYEMMKQVTAVQGDMARTLKSPSNQLRILKAQLVMAARALGQVFIPMLNAALPYVIAFTVAVRKAADALSKLTGFELPTVDYSSLDSSTADLFSDVADSTSDTADNLADATSEAKKLKKTIMGFDELNILSDNSSLADALKDAADAASGAGSGDLGIELPEYDFLKGALENQSNEIAKQIEDMFKKVGALLVGIGLIVTGLILVAFGHPFLGAALIFAGAATLYAAEKFSPGILQEQLNTLFHSVYGIIAGMALIVLGLIVMAGGHPLLGIGLIVAGAATVAATAVLNPGILNSTVAEILSGVLWYTGSALMILGILVLGAGQVPLGIGMIVAGAAMMVTAAVMNVTQLNGTISQIFAQVLIFTAVPEMVMGILLIGFGQLGVGIALLAMGAIQVVTALVENPNAALSSIQSFFSSIGGVLTGIALVGMGIFLLMTGNIPFGVALLAAGAVSLVTAAVMNWDTVTGAMNQFFNQMAGIVGASTLALGAILLMTPGANGLGLALIAVGAATLITGVIANWSGTVNAVGQMLKDIGMLAGSMLIPLGLMVLMTGNLPIGLALIVGGAVTMIAGVALNWSSLDSQTKAMLTQIAVISGVFAVAIGIMLCLTGAGLPLGIALIALGATALVTAAVLNFNKTISTIGEFFKAVGKVLVGVALVALGVLLIGTGVGLPLGIGLIAAGVSAITKPQSFSVENLINIGKQAVAGLQKGVSDAWTGFCKFWEGCFKNVVEWVKNFFGIHSPSTLFEGFGLNMVYGLQNGFKSIGTVFSNIFKTISGGISGFGKNMYTWGSEMMGNLVTGINSGLSTLAQKVASAAATIRSYLHFSQPDVGPLADFNSWMPDMMSQLAGGIADNEDQVKKQVAKLAGDMSLESTVKANVTGSGAAPVGTAVGDNTSGLVSAVYTAVANALAAQNGGDDDGGQPIIINLGNEQIASYLVKQNKRVALISGGKA